MPGQRGVARRTTPRRRTMRTRIKSGYPIYVRRFKMLLFSRQGKGKFLVDTFSTAELKWELTVLDKLEQMCYSILEGYAVPTFQYWYYLGFCKKIWEARVKFAAGTYELEKESLITEYTLRGLDPTILNELLDECEELAKFKVADVIIYPYADAGVEQEFPDTNFGDADMILVSGQINLNTRGFFKFTLGTIIKDISKAVFRVYGYWIAYPISGVSDIECRKVPTLEFDEMTITWNNQPAYGDVLDTAVIDPTLYNQFLEFDVTDYVKGQKAGPGIATFCLKVKVEDWDNWDRGIGLPSKENVDPLIMPGYPAPALRIYY